MADEFMILFENDADFSVSEKPNAIFRVVGDEMTITAKDDETFESWGSYVEESPSWKLHVETEGPLSSLFGRTGYTTAEWYPYTDKTKADYEKAVKDFGGETRTFKPKKN